MKKHIYVLYTGGTLGMQKTEQGFRPVANWFEQQLRALPELTQAQMPDFTLHEYSPLLDSSDISPAHWQRMAEDIVAHYPDYDGFVVLHGTDTMAYSAAALSHLLQGLSKPVILTGAQIPLSEPHSDTQANVRNALYAAAHWPHGQVALLFAQGLYDARFVTKHSASDLSGFASFNAAPLLTWQGTELTLPAAESHPEPALSPLKLGQVQDKKLWLLTFHPGMDYTLVAKQLAEPWDVVILHSYGAGNIPQHPVLWQALEQAAARGVHFINHTQCRHGQVASKYASGHKMQQLGVEFSTAESLESTLARALICA